MRTALLPAAAALVLCSLPFAQPVFAQQWDTLQVPTQPFIVNLQTWDGVLYGTSTNGNVFKSLDTGATWEMAFKGLEFTINPNNGFFYRFADAGARFERSLDHGSTWTDLAENPFFDPAPNVALTKLTFSNDTLYAYSLFNDNPGLLRRDPQDWTPVTQLPNGEMFTQCHVMGPHIWALSIFALRHSPDGGATWTTVSDSSWVGTSLAVAGDTVLVHYSPDNTPAYILARTIDQGSTWETDTTHPGYFGNISNGRPFYTSDGGNNNGYNMYYSWNGLTGWDTLIAPNAYQDYGKYLPNDIELIGDSRIMAMPSGILYGKGSQWKRGFFGYSIPGEGQATQFYLRKTPDALLFGSEGLGFGLSVRPDVGNSWPWPEKYYFSEQLFQIGNQWLGVGGAGTYRTANTSFDWEVVNTQSGRLVQTNGVFYMKEYKTIFRSGDNGSTWVQTGLLPQLNVFYDIPFASLNGKLFTLLGSSLVVSADEGATWSTAYTFDHPLDLPNSRLHTLQGRIFLSQSYAPSRVYVSADEGATFDTLQVPGALDVKVHGNTLLLKNGDGFLYVSTDTGQTWKQLPPPYFGFGYIDIEGATANDSMVYLYDGAQNVAWMLNFKNLSQWEGTVYLDQNGNGQQDAGEKGVPDLVLKTRQSVFFGVTDASGHFRMSVNPAKDTVEIGTTIPHYSPQPLFYGTQGSGTAPLDFALQPTATLTDLAVHLSLPAPFRPGFTNTFSAVVRNNGTTKADGALKIVLDPALSYQTATPFPAQQSGDTLVWDIQQLPPLEALTFHIQTQTDLVDIGSAIHLNAQVLAQLADDTPADNLFDLDAIVVGSYDPNDKTVLPEAVPPAVAAQGATLRYTIRFQNTGTYPTSFVVLRDTLDSRLKPESIRILAASHPFSWRLAEGRILEFKFNPLNLPPAQDDEPNSHGFIQFAIDLKPNLSLGDQVGNTAYIHFDYNPAIVTNTAIMTVKEASSTHSPVAGAPEIHLHPNPATRFVTISFNGWPDETGRLSLLRTSGETVLEHSPVRFREPLRLDLTDLPAGQYWLQAVAASGQRVLQVLVVIR